MGISCTGYKLTLILAKHRTPIPMAVKQTKSAKRPGVVAAGAGLLTLAIDLDRLLVHVLVGLRMKGAVIPLRDIIRGGNVHPF
jgi:hypothetical protein